MFEELIATQWDPYQRLVSTDKILEIISPVINFLDDPLLYIIPSIVMGSDGPLVQSVIIRTETFIGESRLVNNGDDFDIMRASTIANYRVKLWAHEIILNLAAIELAKKNNEEPPAPEVLVYQSAQVWLTHNFQNFRSDLNYFGSERDHWLTMVRTAFPPSIVRN